MPAFYEGVRVRLVRDLEDLRAGWLGTVRLGPDRDLGVVFDGRPACVAVRRYLDGWSVRVLNYVEIVEVPKDVIRS